MGIVEGLTRKDFATMKDLKELNKVRIDLYDIEKFYNIKEYEDLVVLVNKLIADNIISPTKTSKINGKHPWLYKRYRLIEVEEVNIDYINEIRNELYIGLNTEYYLFHIEVYKNDREHVLALSNFLRNHKQSLDIAVSINERSFEIWGEEKFLKNGRGKTILKNVAYDIDNLNFYSTPEPFTFYSFSTNPNQRILIIENKDTWYSIRKSMKEGNNDILGVCVDTIIYGAGKGIFNSLIEYDLIEQEYLKKPKEVLYWGDIDYEGIKIYEGLKEKYQEVFNIIMFSNAYKKMIQKSTGKKLPVYKESQNKNISTIFFNELDVRDREFVIEIFKKGLYIPQEIVTYKDLIERRN